MSTTDFEAENLKNVLDQHENYDSYLDSFIQTKDMEYLGNIDTARQLIELGLNIKTQILSKKEFIDKKRLLEELRKNENKKRRIKIMHKEVEQSLYSDEPFLQHIADREEMILQGKIQTIIFLRVETFTSDQKPCEISGFIDLGHRLKTENFKAYFTKKKVLMPKRTDLSYLNWNTGAFDSNESKNFKCKYNTEKKQLEFVSQRDSKLVQVSGENLSQDTTKTVVDDSKIQKYKQVIFFDLHFSKKVNEEKQII